MVTWSHLSHGPVPATSLSHSASTVHDYVLTLSSILLYSMLINSLGPSDAIWRQGSGSTLAQVMAYAWRHHAITWNNVDLSSVKSSDIHLRTSSQETPQTSITEIICKIKSLKFHSNFPEANGLTRYSLMTTYDDKNVDQVWLNEWLGAAMPNSLNQC